MYKRDSLLRAFNPELTEAFLGGQAQADAHRRLGEVRNAQLGGYGIRGLPG